MHKVKMKKKKKLEIINRNVHSVIFIHHDPVTFFSGLFNE